MTTSYDDAVQALYRAPLGKFVEERKRLATEVAPAESKLFLKLPRPSVSAWATNQLFWQARPAFDELFETGERLRAGELDATAAHRQATNQLVTRAAAILEEAGHAASEATLRRVSTNLAALAAQGDFAPDPPGALKSDREPPGFGALEGMNLSAPRPAAAKPAVKDPAAVAAAERKRLAEDQARLRAERTHVEGALRAAKANVESRSADEQRLTQELSLAVAELAKARALVEKLETRVSQLAALEGGTKVTADDA